MEDELCYDLAGLVHLPRTHVTTRELIPPMIYRLAHKRGWDRGEVPMEVRFHGPDVPAASANSCYNGIWQQSRPSIAKSART